jgi:hypothetical protein
MTSVIALSGWARTGKDTIADYLVEQHGYRKISFATPMREALYRLNPLVNTIEGDTVPLSQIVNISGWEIAKEITPDLRGLMQRLGTEVGREMFGDDFWVNIAFSQIKPGEKVVLADCRYQNEANATATNGGQVWRVERPGFGPANSHESERDLDNYAFSHVFSNDTGIENLNAQVEEYLNANI